MANLFISYSRSDEAFVTRLHADLTKHGFEVWWDRVAMDSRGRTFLQEIRDAIASVERVILVVGPEAMRSDYVRVEWQFALEACKIVIPIVRRGRPSLVPEEAVRSAYALIPRGLASFHAPDFVADSRYDHAFDELRRILSVAVPPLAAPDAVIELPPAYLPRPEVMNKIGKAVLADHHAPLVVGHESRVTALVGMGGVGKSVLGAAFARDCGTRRAMDSVHWLEVGRAGDVATSLRALAGRLGVRVDFGATVEEAKARIAERLAPLTCLIVLDDVWALPEAAAIRDLLGPRCRLVITTRLRKLASDLGARLIPVDALDEAAAMDLLARTVHLAVDALPVEAPDIANECGRLPLAIAMIGGTLRANPDRWTQALHKLRAADPSRVASELPNYDHPDLLRAIDVSVESLSARTRDRFLDFAVFPEGAAVPESVVAQLWKHNRIDGIDAADMLDDLVNRSLLSRHSAGRLGIHDLLLDYVRFRAGDLSSLHEQLLASYTSQCDGGWATGPDDGYFFQQLSHHLQQSGRTAGLVTLLTGSSAWPRASLRADPSGGSLIVDIDRARASSTDVLVLATLATLRIAVQERSASWPEGVLRALVWLGRTDVALANARVRATPVETFNALLAIHESAREKDPDVHGLGGELFRAAQTVNADQDKVNALKEVGLLMAAADDPRSIQAFQLARSAANRLPDAWQRSLMLCRLAAALTESPQLSRVTVLDEAWVAIESRLADAEITSIQMDVALAFGSAGQFERAEAITEGMMHEGWKENARAYLPRALAEAGRPDEALVRARHSSFSLEVSLPAIAEALARAGRFPEARALIPQVRSPDDGARVQRELARMMARSGARGAKTAFGAAWAACRVVEDADTRVAALCDLAISMVEASDARGMAVLKDAVRQWERARHAYPVLANTIGYNVASTFARLGHPDDAFRVASGVPDSGWRSAALGHVASAMARQDDPRAAAVLEEAIAAAEATLDERAWIDMLRALCMLLSRGGCYGEAWQVARLIPAEWERSAALTELGAAMGRAGDPRAREVLDEVLPLVPTSGTEHDRAEFLADTGVALHLSGDPRAKGVLAQALTLARKVTRSGHAPAQLAKLAGKLCRCGHPQGLAVAEEAARLARAERDRSIRVGRLGDLARELRDTQPQLAATLVEEATRAVPLRGKVHDQEAAFRLVDVLVGAGRCDDARRLIGVLSAGPGRPEAEGRLVACLREAQRWPEAFSVASSMEPGLWAAEALVELAVAMTRVRAGGVDRVVTASLAALEAMDPSPLRTKLRSQLHRVLVLLGDGRQATFFARARAEDAGGANWSGILADHLVEGGRLIEALGDYRASDRAAFVHTLSCWVWAFERSRPGLGLHVLQEATRILGWSNPAWERLHGILAQVREWSAGGQPSDAGPPAPTGDTAIPYR